MSDDRLISRRHVPELTGLRGAATIIVVFTHCWFYQGADGPWWLLDQVRFAGWISLDTFFALSGCLITGILVDSRGKPRYWRTFFVRRALRVFPVYYLVMFVLFAVIRPLGELTGYALRDPIAPWWSHFAYVANFYVADAEKFGFIPAEISWSLCIEEHFYTVWPFVVALFSRRAFVWLLAAICVFSPLIRLGVFDATGGAMVPVYVLTYTRMDAVCYGALMALWLRRERDDAQTERAATWIARAAGVLWALVLLGILTRTYDREWAVCVALGYSLTPAATAALIGAIYLGRAQLASRFLRARVFLSIGGVSYAIYLTHVMILTMVNRLPWTTRLFAGFKDNPWIALAHTTSIFLVAYGIALLSWRWFEKPIVDLKDRLAPYSRST